MYKQLTKLISVSNAFVCAYLFQMRNEPEKRNKLINFMRKNNFLFCSLWIEANGQKWYWSICIKISVECRGSEESKRLLCKCLLFSSLFCHKFIAYNWLKDDEKKFNSTAAKSIRKLYGFLDGLIDGALCFQIESIVFRSHHNSIGE